ncbi:MAG: hypothetical protein KDA37_06960, partial [Planctomycetales bacterium]|nr:hypothetical protein [Planctomycetales bacterium]
TRSEQPCWIQYTFAEPFTCRAITVTPDGANYQCQRLGVHASDDGRTFRPVAVLAPPRHGWQEEGRPVTHAVPRTTARHFRFTWTPAGSEPGAEDLDNAKWAPVLKLNSISLSSEPVIHQYLGKSGAVWRVAPWTNEQKLPAADCVPLASVIDLTSQMGNDGSVDWKPPAGEWTLLHVGHTSTGRENATGGAAKGLECDKLNPAAVRLQFDKWFGEFRRQFADELGEDAAQQLLTTFHLDSWECGSQNWSPGFDGYFKTQRGYDLTRFLPCVAGIPVQSAETSERFLRDLRATIAERMSEAFYGTIAELTRERGLTLVSECTAPTMCGDGMLHFSQVDVPMGEFWLNSPTHDKPNDMCDAISAAHVYGKPVIQAEAFTQLRIGWDASPRTLKRLGDRNLALGANRMVMHVFAHNPWLDRKPGQTLGGVGLFFQRDQPWFTASRGWMDYFARCGAVLQQGRPVADIAVWTSDDLPRRSLTPDRLTNDLPGLFAPQTLALQRRRIENHGQPQREMPHGVRASA